MQRSIKEGSSKSKKQHYLDGNFHRVFDQVLRHDRHDLIVRLFNFVAGMEPKQLTAALGQHDFLYQGERRCKCWLLKHKGEEFLLVSANERGTTVECARTVETDAIQDFLQEVVKHLQALNDARVKSNSILLE